MKPLWVFYSLIVILLAACLFVFAFQCEANTIGLSYDRAAGDSSFGVYADYQKDEIAQNLDFEFDGQYQNGHTANIDASFTLFNNFRIESNNYFEGEKLDLDIGRRVDLGASFVFDIKDLEVSIGIFGVNGNPFDPVKTATWDNDTGEWVADNPDEIPIPIKKGSTINIAAKTEFNKDILGRNFEVGLRGLFDFAGEDENAKYGKVHQLEASISTGGEFDIGVNWTLRLRLAAQAYQEGENFHTASQIRSITAGVEYPF